MSSSKLRSSSVAEKASDANVPKRHFPARSERRYRHHLPASAATASVQLDFPRPTKRTGQKLARHHDPRSPSGASLRERAANAARA